jgi:hypothetical protein
MSRIVVELRQGVTATTTHQTMEFVHRAKSTVNIIRHVKSATAKEKYKAMKKIRVLVCGDRDWTDKEYMFSIMDAMHLSTEFVLIIEGGARGADSMAGEWATERGIPLKVYPANWEKFRKAAGPIRNQQMLDEGKPELVVAFHSDIESSKGTKDMVKRAKKADLPVLIFKGSKIKENATSTFFDESEVK